jgi:toxin ParE1/3/4
MYNVMRTDKTEDQLRELIFYITNDSGSAKIALDYLEKIEKAITDLELFPNSGAVPRYSILKKQGYRVKIVERHLIFYKVFEESQSVMIYAIVDGRQEYLDLI